MSRETSVAERESGVDDCCGARRIGARLFDAAAIVESVGIYRLATVDAWGVVGLLPVAWGAYEVPGTSLTGRTLGKLLVRSSLWRELRDIPVEERLTWLASAVDAEASLLDAG